MHTITQAWRAPDSKPTARFPKAAVEGLNNKIRAVTNPFALILIDHPLFSRITAQIDSSERGYVRQDQPQNAATFDINRCG